MDVWILVLVMGGANAGGAIEKLAHYPNEQSCKQASKEFLPTGGGGAPRVPWAFCVPAPSETNIIR
ncbi:MAG: hypothetical protein WC670_09110 [Pseudolabrys sp.]|jgi:hypothetical protein